LDKGFHKELDLLEKDLSTQEKVDKIYSQPGDNE